MVKNDSNTEEAPVSNTSKDGYVGRQVQSFIDYQGREYRIEGEVVAEQRRRRGARSSCSLRIISFCESTASCAFCAHSKACCEAWCTKPHTSTNALWNDTASSCLIRCLRYCTIFLAKRNRMCIYFIELAMVFCKLISNCSFTTFIRPRHKL